LGGVTFGLIGGLIDVLEYVVAADAEEEERFRDELSDRLVPAFNKAREVPDLLTQGQHLAALHRRDELDQLLHMHIYMNDKKHVCVENRARLGWLASAVAVLHFVVSSAASAPTYHRALFI
jgi:hypothetical protein